MLDLYVYWGRQTPGVHQYASHLYEGWPADAKPQREPPQFLYYICNSHFLKSHMHDTWVNNLWLSVFVWIQFESHSKGRKQ